MDSFEKKKKKTIREKREIPSTGTRFKLNTLDTSYLLKKNHLLLDTGFQSIHLRARLFRGDWRRQNKSKQQKKVHKIIHSRYQ